MGYRDYNHSPEVKMHYLEMRMGHTLKKNEQLRKDYLTFEMDLSIQDAMEYLKDFVDVSDPDMTIPNINHLYQTAERMRIAGEPDYMQVTGLIHDLGKILYLKGCSEDGTSVDSQWAITGDTFFVGCELPSNCIYPEFNKVNNDYLNPFLNNKYGIYKERVGFDNCLCSFGHDEYLYQILANNYNELPEECRYIIRYHSLYPHHSCESPETSPYYHLMDDKDIAMFYALKSFQNYDLYSKEDKPFEITPEIKTYYDSLIRKFFPNRLLF